MEREDVKNEIERIILQAVPIMRGEGFSLRCPSHKW